MTSTLCAAQPPPASAWAVKDAPYRAVFRLKEPSLNPETGVLLELPEFGQTPSDLADLLLTDAAGAPQPLAGVYRQSGAQALLLARAMLPGEDYFLYCGGGKSRGGQSWTPKVSLFMETRPVAGVTPRCDSWGEMETLWRRSPERGGGAFVANIYHGENPFGPDTNFITRYTGCLNPPTGNTVELLTASADASFVSVNDHNEFGWPGKHAGDVLPNEMRGKAVPRGSGPLKIDYYQVKGADDYRPAMVLAWKVGGKPEAIPPEAWFHPGKSDFVRFEAMGGQPVPTIAVHLASYLGYGGEWFYHADFALRQSPPPGWSVAWNFEDGVTVAAVRGSRILTGPDPQLIRVALTREGTTIKGVARVHFPNELGRVHLEQPTSVLAYANLAAADDPGSMRADAARARVLLLLEFGTDGQVAKFAPAWLRADPGFTNPLTPRVFNAFVHAQAEADPRKALEILRAVPSEARARCDDVLSRLEIDLLVFYLRDPNAEGRANQLSFTEPNSETRSLMSVRIGDAARLQGRYDEAAARYRTATTRHDVAGRAAARNQAYSITVDSLLAEERRDGAAAKLTEWEINLPLAKLTTDFLLLRARVAMSFGRWHEARTELESYAKMTPESPYLIDTRFYLAQALAGGGQIEEARGLWTKLARDYPRSPFAAKSKELATGTHP